MDILVFNPGSNSLKAGIVACSDGQQAAADGVKRVEVIAEGIGAEAKLSVYNGKKIASTVPLEAGDFKEAAAGILDWLDREGAQQGWDLDRVGCVGVRVVHGGSRFTQPAEITEEVEREIVELGKWAPLHNHRSVEILEPLRHFTQPFRPGRRSMGFPSSFRRSTASAAMDFMAYRIGICWSVTPRL
jgi:acetate kinase